MRPSQRPPRRDVAVEAALSELARGSDADLVVNALVGFVGLAPTLAALSAGIPVAVANKESIVAGGEITKAARNWLGNKLDASRRSQLLFMDRDDILNLYVVTNLPLPKGAIPDAPTVGEDDIPF